MIFDARSERALAQIEARLTKSDPRLAVQFDRFNHQPGPPPPQERYHSHQRRRGVALLMIALTPLIVLIVWGTVATMGHRGPGACTSVSASCMPRHPACQQAAADPMPPGSQPCAAGHAPAGSPG